MDFDDIYSMDEPKEETEAKSNTVEETNTASDETKLTKSVSIYDSSNTNEENQNTETIENKTSEETINYTFSTTDKKLSYIGNDSDSLPTEIFYQFGLKTLILDISFNAISDLRDLQQFPYLEELICDNNDISENSHFPKLESLKIFSCNKNHIDDIHIFIDKIKVNFPNLTYLSLLGNRACPNQLIDPNKDEYDYSRYRKYVLYRMKKLKFLDCYEVTKEEREMIADDSLFLDVVTPSNQTNGAAKKNETDQRNDSNEYYTPLTALDANKSDKQETQGSFGYCRYIYYGKQSEGNRFIRNDDL